MNKIKNILKTKIKFYLTYKDFTYELKDFLKLVYKNRLVK